MASAKDYFRKRPLTNSHPPISAIYDVQTRHQCHDYRLFQSGRPLTDSAPNDVLVTTCLMRTASRAPGRIK